MAVLIELQTIIAAPVERCFDLSLSVDAHLAGTTKARERVAGGVSSGVMALGDRVEWEATHFYVRQRLSTEITKYDRPRAFTDTMRSGAFAWMEHDHTFGALRDGTTMMGDRFRFAAPFPILGPLAERLFLERYMRGLLIDRNAALKAIAESDDWQRFVNGPTPLSV